MDAGCRILLRSADRYLESCNMRFRTTQNNLVLPELPTALEGMRIIHLGDLHECRFGTHNEILAAAIIQENPDFIFVSGDMLDRHKQSGEAFLELLEQLEGRFSVYACHGNHELRVKKKAPECYTKYIRRAEGLGVCFLEEEGIVLKKNGQSFWLYGLSTAASGFPCTIESVTKRLGRSPEDAPVFVLAHDPLWFDVLAEWGADAAFSGHVHGGMIRLPGIGGLFSPGPGILPKYDKGIYTRKGSVMYLTVGFGAWGFRFLNPRELAVLTLTRKVGLSKCTASRRIGSIVGTILLLCLLFLGVWPVAMGVPGPVSVAFIVGAVCGLVCLHTPLLSRLRRNRWLDVTWRVGCGVLYLVSLIILSMSVLMTSAILTQDTPADATVIVLGCLIEDDRPSDLMVQRLTAALEYLKQHPDSVCVVSGGQGADERYTEASVMRKWLLENGVSAERIYVEDQSVNTRENLQFSANIIAKSGLNSQVAIATDDFHQFRSQHLARQAGLNPVACASRTPDYLFATNWVRECFALLKMLTIG